MNWVVCDECGTSYPAERPTCPRCSSVRHVPLVRAEPGSPGNQEQSSNRASALWVVLGFVRRWTLVALGLFVLYRLGLGLLDAAQSGDYRTFWSTVLHGR